MATYKYSVLPPDGSSIRLLRLLPSREATDKIVCEIFPASLLEQSASSYEALSYTWGDAKQTVDVELSGFVFPVTLNLDSALRALRRPSEVRTLWVDAVCINQADLQECGQQVQMMWAIYKEASCVVIWLGPEEGESDAAMASFGRSEAQMRNEMRRYKRPQPDGYQRSDWCGCHAGNWESFPSRIGVQSLLGRRWFTRVWVLQEVAAAKEVVVVCGSQVIGGNDFCLEVIGVTFVHKSLQKLLRKIRPAIDLMHQSPSVLQKQSLPLLELIETFRSWEATKMVDKVYSLLAFSSDAYNEPELRPDYTISADVLAQKIVRFAIPHSVIMQPAEAESNLVTFEIDGFILGTVKEKWSEKENMRSWIFDANKTTGNIGPVDTEINHLVAQLFEDSWQIDLLSERKLHLDDIICLLRGVSRPSVLRFKDGQYSVVMLATPEPSRRRHEVGILGGGYKIVVRDPASFLAKIPKPTSSQKSWAEILSILASKSGGRQNFTLSWDPFREPTSDEVSTFQPTVNHPDIQWEARLESIYDTAKNETEKTGNPPIASHDCKTITMLRMMYNSADKEIKAGTSEHTITLHTATLANWLGTVKLLLEANAEVDDRDEDGATALCYAAAANRPKIVDALLKAKAEVDRRSPSDLGQTPLDLAASKGYAEVCKLLLDGGANPNPTKANESSYLFDPAVKGFVDTVKVLLKAGANPNATETIGPEADVGALLLAAETGHLEIVRALLDAGAEVDAVTSTATRALHQAAMNGHTDVVKLLLAAGADVNAQNVDGVTPLDFAVFRQNFETADGIADAGGIQVKTLPSDEDEDDRVADDGQ